MASSRCAPCASSADPFDTPSLTGDTRMSAQLAPAPAARFTKVGQNRTELPADAAGHLAVLDAETGLYHAVGVCPKRLSPKGAQKLADKLNAEKYAGLDTWRVPL